MSQSSRQASAAVLAGASRPGASRPGTSRPGASRPGASRPGASREVEGLLRLGSSLAAATTADDLRQALRNSLPDLVAPAQAPWALTRDAGVWEAVAGGRPEAPRRPRPALEAVAERVLRLGPDALGATGGIECEGQLCFPLVAGGSVVGVLGACLAVPAAAARPLLAAVAAVLGLAVGHVRLLAEGGTHGTRDGLTGCSTRPCGMRALDAALERGRHTRRPVSLAMVDLDHFKCVNDRHGHLCGDAVLAAAGARLRAVTRAGGFGCRFGGDEVLLVLPDTPRDRAARVAEALRRGIVSMKVRWQGVPVPTAASIGVASGGAGTVDARALIARADAALYRAKKAGRNRVCVERGGPGPESAERRAGASERRAGACERRAGGPAARSG